MTPDPERHRMDRAKQTGELADRVFAYECARLGLNQHAALRAPLLVIAAASMRAKGNA